MRKELELKVLPGEADDLELLRQKAIKKAKVKTKGNCAETSAKTQSGSPEAATNSCTQCTVVGTQCTVVAKAVKPKVHPLPLWLRVTNWAKAKAL